MSSETADAISGLGPEAVSHNRSAISQYNPGSGFSGVFDPDTGKFLAYPSGETVLTSGDIPANRVRQYGGHRDVNRALSEVDGLNPNRLGFSMTLDASGEFVVGFNSRQVNLPNPNFEGHTVPGPMRQQILDAIEQATGRKARQVEN